MMTGMDDRDSRSPIATQSTSALEVQSAPITRASMGECCRWRLPVS